MKWFKHHCDLSRDERIASFKDECGKKHLEGIGFLCGLLEIVAEQMSKEHPEPRHTLSLPQWSHQLHCHHHTFSKYIGKLEVTGVVTVDKHGSKWTVTIPELSNWAADYINKSRLSSNRVPSKEKRKEEKRREGEETPTTLAKTPLPSDFSVSQEMREWATKRLPGVDVDSETEKFVCHHRAEGASSRDWVSRWKKWMLHAKDFKKTDSSAEPDEKRRRDMLDLGKKMDIKQKPDESDEQYLLRVERNNNRRIEKLSA